MSLLWLSFSAIVVRDTVPIAVIVSIVGVAVIVPVVAVTALSATVHSFVCGSISCIRCKIIIIITTQKILIIILNWTPSWVQCKFKYVQVTKYNNTHKTYLSCCPCRFFFIYGHGHACLVPFRLFPLLSASQPKVCPPSPSPLVKGGDRMLYLWTMYLWMTRLGFCIFCILWPLDDASLAWCIPSIMHPWPMGAVR
jgi:hypothetical protein